MKHSKSETLPFKSFTKGRTVKHRVWEQGRITARWEDDGKTYIEVQFKEGRKIFQLETDHQNFKIVQEKPHRRS